MANEIQADEKSKELLLAAPSQCAANLVAYIVKKNMQNEFRICSSLGESMPLKEQFQRFLDRQLIDLHNSGLLWTDQVRLVVVNIEGTRVNFTWKHEPFPETA